MTDVPAFSSLRLNRRGLFRAAGFAGAAAMVPALASCSKSGSGAGGALKFWDMPWSTAPGYVPAATKLTTSYKPASGMGKATYQQIQWANFTETFSSAIASKTGPAVSTGGGFQAFQFASQGAIAYADNVMASFTKDGTINDFLPGLVAPMKTADGYAAVPWQLDSRILWQSKSLFEKAGATTPTDWDSYLTACAALKKIGVYGFATGSGAGNNLGNQGILAFMINNGGGLFDPDGTLDCTYSRNVEAIDWILNLVKEGYVDPAAVSYSGANQNTQWKAQKYGMGIDVAGLPANAGITTNDLVVMSPIAGPHGDKGGLLYENNVMMYKETPSQSDSEAFLEYYIKNMKVFWESSLGLALPVLKSIVALPAFQAQPNSVKVINEWQPISKTLAARGTGLSAKLAAVDASTPLFHFAQSVLGGQTTATAALGALQSGLEPLVK